MNSTSEADGTLYVAVSAGNVRVAPRATLDDLQIMAGMRAANRRRVKRSSKKYTLRLMRAAWEVAFFCSVLTQLLRAVLRHGRSEEPSRVQRA
jgi:hypothetical protein